MVHIGCSRQGGPTLLKGLDTYHRWKDSLVCATFPPTNVSRPLNFHHIDFRTQKLHLRQSQKLATKHLNFDNYSRQKGLTENRSTSLAWHCSYRRLWRTKPRRPRFWGVSGATHSRGGPAPHGGETPAPVGAGGVLSAHGVPPTSGLSARVWVAENGGTVFPPPF